MTIEYKDSKRIVNLSTDVANTTTFNELFDSTGHTSDGTTVNGWYATDISALKYDGDNDNMYFNNAMDSTDDIMYYDLQNSNALGSGNFANATKWVVRMKINITTSSGTGSNGNQFSIGLSSAVGITDTYDFMGIHIVQNHSSAGDIVCNATVNNGYPQNQGTSGNRLGATSIDMASSSDWWLEIKRDGNDCTCTLYEDEFTGTSYTKTNTVTDISNLRYIFFRPQKDSGGATFTGSIDNIEVYDNVSTLTNKPTDVQDNSLLIEKDTARRYWRTPPTSDYTQYGWAVDNTTKIQTLGASASLPSTGTFTWSFWYKPNSISAEHYLFNKFGSQSNDYSPRAFLQTTGALKATSTVNNVGYGGNAITSNTMTIGEWNHVIVKQTGSTIYAILNNGTAASASVLTGNNSAEDYLLFEAASGTDGAIKNAILYSTALSSSDITSLYNSGVPATSSTAGVTSNILIEHIFDSSVSTTSAANTGSLSGSASVTAGTASVVGTPATWTGNFDLTGLKSYYNFEQTSTTLTNMATSVGSTDSLGSSGDATGSGTITKGATGIIGNAWDFGGGKITTSHQFLPTSGDYTFSTWVSLDDVSTAGEEILRHESPSFEVWRNSGGLNVSGASGTINIEPASNLANNTWYNIVLVHSSSGDISYLNGVSKSTSDITSVPTGTSWYLGGRSGSGEAINGKIDETTVWSRALSSSEVSSLYNEGRGKIVY